MPARSIGIERLPVNMARALAEYTSFGVMVVTSLAAFFLKHSNKMKLSVSDVNLAIT